MRASSSVAFATGHCPVQYVSAHGDRRATRRTEVIFSGRGARRPVRAATSSATASFRTLRWGPG